MKHVLSLNPNPTIRAWSHTLFAYSILETDQHIGPLNGIVSNFKVDGNPIEIGNKEQLTFKNNIEISNDHNAVHFLSDPYAGERYYFHLFKKQGKSNIEIKIDYLQQMNPWALVYLFVTDSYTLSDDDPNAINRIGIHFNRYIHYIGRMSDRGLVCSDKSTQQILINTPFGLKLTVDESINGYYQANGQEWKHHFTAQNTLPDEYYIGLVFMPLKNHIYDWTFTNFTQLLYSPGNSYHLPIDYLFAFARPYEIMYINPFLMRQCYPHTDFDYEKEGEDFLQFLIYHLNKGYCIELFLNEYYVPDRWAYRRSNYNHGNLIYGYDDEKEILYLLGLKGNPVISTVTFQDFLSACRTMGEGTVKTIQLLKYHDSLRVYNFDLPLVVEFLKEYLNGKDSLTRTHFFQRSHDSDLIFGLPIIDHFIHNENSLGQFVKDNRIPYVIFEHKKVMSSRIEFLYKRKIFDIDEYTHFTELFTDIKNVSQIILNKVLYYSIKSIQPDYDYMKNLLSNLRDKEQLAISELITCLSAKE